MLRVLIFTGGALEAWALNHIEESDYIIGVDRGAKFLIENEFQPHISLGDFDSVTTNEKELIKRKSLQYLDCDPIDKNVTDTEMAFNFALEKKPDEIVIFGATGTRMDHSLANIQLLYRGTKEGIPSKIIDKNNELTVMDQELEIIKGDFDQVSLLPLSLEVTGITLKGFKYPLNNATIKVGDSLGISNILAEDRGFITITSGVLLVIKSKD